jgi:Hypoxia induced protein conserved region
MDVLMKFVLALALAAVLGVLGMGLVQMVKGNDPHRSNKLMEYRVVLRGLALGLFALLLLTIGS